MRQSDCYVFKTNTGNTVPSPTWCPSPTWRKQKAFPFPGTVALWVFCKSREFPAFFQGPRTVLCSPTWDAKQSISTLQGWLQDPGNSIICVYFFSHHMAFFLVSPTLYIYINYNTSATLLWWTSWKAMQLRIGLVSPHFHGSLLQISWHVGWFAGVGTLLGQEGGKRMIYLTNRAQNQMIW